MTTVATSSLSTVGFEEEHTPGTTNASPALTTFLHSSFGLKLSKDTVKSDMKNSTRMPSRSRHTIRRAAGPIACDLYHKGQSVAWQALMGGTWTDGVALDSADFTNLSVVASTSTWTLGSGNPITLGLRVGDKVTIAGFSTTANNGTYIIKSLAADSFTTIEAPSADESTVTSATVTVSGKKLGIGRSYRAFTFERALTDVGQFAVFNGVYFTKLGVSMDPGQIVKLNWETVGMDAAPMASSSIDGTGEVTKSESDLGDLTISGNVITCAASNWTAEGLTAGDVFTLTSVTGITGFPDKQLTVVSISTTALTVAEAIPDGTATAYTLTKTGLPDYTDAEEGASMTALEGGIYIGDDLELVATITAMQFDVDNQMDGAAVVGKNYVPTIVWGKEQTVSGSLTALFTGRGMYNRFDEEETAPVLFQAFDPAGKFYTFRMPCVRFNSGDLGDAVDTGLPIQMEFVAEPATTAQVAAGWDSGHFIIQESA